MNLATVINFCSNDYPFLRHCVEGAKPFSSQILVPLCDHFFDGQREDRDLLNAIYAENDDVEFIEFPYAAGQSSIYWHNLARLIGSYYLRDSIEHVLFLDCDEIIDVKRFAQWLSDVPYREFQAVRFDNYWYFRESCHQAKTWEDLPMLARKEVLNGELIMQERERAGMYEGIQGKKMRHVSGTDGKPMIHHYSWVRTKEQLFRKVRSWGHHWERDWTRLVEEEFSRPFTGRDFVHGYEFVDVPPYIDVDLHSQPPPTTHTAFQNVRFLTRSDVAKIDIALTYDITLPKANAVFN